MKTGVSVGSRAGVARAVLTFFSAALVVAVLACPASAGKFSEGSTDVIVVGVPAERCPVFYTDPATGEVVGIGADLMRAAAGNAGYTAKFEVTSERSLKEALDNESYDVVMPFGSAVASAAGDGTVVTESLMQVPFTLVTLEDRSIPPLNRLRVGMPSSMRAGADTVKEMYPEIEIGFYDGMDDAVSALRKGEVDGLLHNSYVWSYLLQKPSYGDLRVQPGSVFSMDFRAGTRDTERGRAVVARLDEGISKMTDAQRQAITLDYTSRKLYRYDFYDYLFQYGLWIALAAALAALLAALAVKRTRAVHLAHEKEIQDIVDHDPLTGTLSRGGFVKRAEELVRVNPGLPYMIAYLNIKNFKYINDTLGRDEGDELLRFWADTIKSGLSEKEAIGRINADCFAVLRCHKGDEARLRKDMEAFAPVRNYFADRGRDYRVLVCAGIYVLTPKDCRKVDIERFVDYARVSERRAHEGRDEGFEFYNPEQWERDKKAAEVVNCLPAAIESGSLHVWYQPQVDYGSGEVTGAEALCRLDHAELGFLEPSEFIEALESAGIIYDLDRYVWERACQDLARWNGEGRRFAVSVNVSRCDVRKGHDIPGTFARLIGEYGLDADQVRIEITESAYVEDPEILIDVTEGLQELGFKVEMDDFGSGYSSLHMLKEVPVDRIKLDLHFLEGSGDAEKGRTIVRYMIQMVASLGIDMIVEGVETKEQADFVLEHGCPDMQGYYFFRPMPVGDFERSVLEGRRAPAGPGGLGGDVGGVQSPSSVESGTGSEE